MTDAKKDTRFKPGQSGNPTGRTPGSGWVAAARKELEKEWNGEKGIKAVLVKKAKEGDMAAIRLVAERVCPPIKAAEPTTPIELPAGTLTERATSVLDALGRGDINTTQASQLIQALGALARVIETDELEKRIKALEKRSDERNRTTSIRARRWRLGRSLSGMRVRAPQSRCERRSGPGAGLHASAAHDSVRRIERLKRDGGAACQALSSGSRNWNTSKLRGTRSLASGVSASRPTVSRRCDARIETGIRFHTRPPWPN